MEVEGLTADVRTDAPRAAERRQGTARSLREAVERSALAWFPPASRDRLMRDGHMLEVPPGAVIHREGDPASASILVTGLVRSFKSTSDGREITLRYARPGDVLGLSTVVAGSFGARSLEPARLAAADLARRFLVVALAAAALQAAAILAVLEVVALRRLRRVHRAALRVAAGDLSVRAGDAEGLRARDEIARVAGEFDRMVRAVAARRVEDERLAATDGLTGLPNRRAFDVQLGSEIDRAERLGYALALSLVDLDGFKALNDSLGHLAGDDALRRVGRALRAAVRRTDIIARYGGDEFAVIHPGCDASAAAAVGVRARAAVEQLGVRAHGGRLLSASVGIAEHRAAITADDLISAADAALYHAKAQGGGVEVATMRGSSA
jgi:diguanylate cyclase (GGDEF)-like protein